MNYLGNDYSGPNSNQQRIDSLSERNKNPGRKEFTGLKLHDNPGDGDWILTLFIIVYLEIHIHVPNTITVNLGHIFFRFIFQSFLKIKFQQLYLDLTSSYLKKCGSL